MTDTPTEIRPGICDCGLLPEGHTIAFHNASNGIRPESDEKGRPLIENMSDREILVELITGQRQLADALEQLEQSPMMRAMLSGQNPLMAMMGKGKA